MCILHYVYQLIYQLNDNIAIPQGYTSSIAGVPWSVSASGLGWDNFFSASARRAHRSVNDSCDLPLEVQESCRMHFMSRYDEKPGIINAQNAGYALWFISDLSFCIDIDLRRVLT